MGHFAPISRNKTNIFVSKIQTAFGSPVKFIEKASFVGSQVKDNFFEPLSSLKLLDITTYRMQMR